jgi:hypothetical protein
MWALFFAPGQGLNSRHNRGTNVLPGQSENLWRLMGQRSLLGQPYQIIEVNKFIELSRV